MSSNSSCFSCPLAYLVLLSPSLLRVRLLYESLVDLDNGSLMLEPLFFVVNVCGSGMVEPLIFGVNVDGSVMVEPLFSIVFGDGSLVVEPSVLFVTVYGSVVMGPFFVVTRDVLSARSLLIPSAELYMHKSKIQAQRIMQHIY